MQEDDRAGHDKGTLDHGGQIDELTEHPHQPGGESEDDRGERDPAVGKPAFPDVDDGGRRHRRHAKCCCLLRRVTGDERGCKSDGNRDQKRSCREPRVEWATPDSQRSSTRPIGNSNQYPHSLPLPQWSATKAEE